ncbi:MAG: MFS transporter [Roseiflexaceae bacterium]|nr:MFS transporter [Roseiflexaceae bacterium]
MAALHASGRWKTLLACCVAATAKLLEPPLWVYREPTVQAFNAGWARYSVLMSTITLGTLAFLLIGGVVGDMFGRRRWLLAGLAGLMIANLLAALSPEPLWFLSTRVLSSAAGALVVPLSLTMLYLAFRGDFQARTMAIAIYISVTSTAGLSAGLLGQFMYSLLDWRTTLIVPAVLALLGLVLIAQTTEESRIAAERRFDLIGHASWSLAALGTLVGISVSQVAGSYATAIVISSVIAVGLGVSVLVWSDLRTPDSLLGRTSLPRRALLVLIVYGVCLQIGFVGFISLVRNVLIKVYDYNVVLAAISLTPLLIGMVLMALFGVRRLMHLRARAVMSAGLLMFCSVIVLAVATRAAGFYPWLALLLAVFGAANVAASTAWTSVFFNLVPKEAIGMRTGMNSSVSQAGGAIGGALTGSLLVSFGLADYLRRLVTAGVQGTQIDAAMAALNTILNPSTADTAIDPSIRDQLIAGYQLTFLAAYEQVLLIVAAIVFVGCVVVWFGLPAKERTAPTLLVEELDATGG